MGKVFRVTSFMEQELTLIGSEQKEYKAKRTGLQEVVNFIQSNDRHGDMADYYKEVLAGEADKEAFADRLEEYLMDSIKQNSPSNGGDGVDREWFSYLGIVRRAQL